jgi:FkbM family methyltransferase
MQGKGWDPSSITPEIDALLKLAHKIEITEMIVLDVGANQGDWSKELLLRNPHAKIYAFEPSKVTFELLVKNLSKFSQMSFIQMGLGSKCSKEILHSDYFGSGMASLSKRKINHLNLEFSKEEVVQITTLDKWIDESNLLDLPNILKIDVEGHELEVLQGAEKSLKNLQIVQFEFGGTCLDSRKYFIDYWRFFRNLGFAIYRMAPRGLIKIEFYSEIDETFRFTNLFAIKQDF